MDTGVGASLVSTTATSTNSLMSTNANNRNKANTITATGVPNQTSTNYSSVKRSEENSFSSEVIRLNSNSSSVDWASSSKKANNHPDEDSNTTTSSSDGRNDQSYFEIFNRVETCNSQNKLNQKSKITENLEQQQVPNSDTDASNTLVSNGDSSCCYNTDSESIKNAGFSKCKKLTKIKKLAGVKITSFDLKNIDSDLDTIRTDTVREKIKEMGSAPATRGSFDDLAGRSNTAKKRSKSSDNIEFFYGEDVKKIIIKEFYDELVLSELSKINCQSSMLSHQQPNEIELKR